MDGVTTEPWPALRVQDWTDTRDTLHMWTQIVGKIRLARAPMVNHLVADELLPLTRHPLTASTIPYPRWASHP